MGSTDDRAEHDQRRETSQQSSKGHDHSHRMGEPGARNSQYPTIAQGAAAWVVGVLPVGVLAAASSRHARGRVQSVSAPGTGLPL